MNHRRALLRMLLASGAVAAAPFMAVADDWPSRPVTMVVTFAAGGPADGIARLIANELSQTLGQRVVIENKGGAGGNIGAATVAKAQPDGYTMLLASSGPGAVNKLIYKSLPYDPLKDFAPVVLIAAVPTIIVGNPKLPVSDLKGLIAYGKSHHLSVGNPGYGTGGHLSAIQFANEAGIAVNHIPYRGVAPMLTDLLAGQIDVGFAGYVPQIAALKPLAVIAPKRIGTLPNVPTVQEAAGIEIVGGVWYGILAPAGTPRLVIDKVNAGVNSFFKTARGQEVSHSVGMLPLGGSPEVMAATMRRDIERLRPVIQGAHISMD